MVDEKFSSPPMGCPRKRGRDPNATLRRLGRIVSFVALPRRVRRSRPQRLRPMKHRDATQPSQEFIRRCPIHGSCVPHTISVEPSSSQALHMLVLTAAVKSHRKKLIYISLCSDRKVVSGVGARVSRGPTSNSERLKSDYQRYIALFVNFRPTGSKLAPELTSNSRSDSIFTSHPGRLWRCWLLF